jgi:class 3 adenylate cyclase
MLHDKIIPFLRKPWLFTGLTAVSLLLDIISVNTAADPLGNTFFPDAYVYPDAIRSFAVSPEGLLAVNQYSDQYSYLYCADPDADSLNWLVQRTDLLDYCGTASRYDIVFGSEGELFLHYVTWTDDECAVATEQVVCLAADGTPGQILCGMDYTNAEDPPTREPRMTAFRYADGILHYAYYDTACTEFYTVDTATGTQQQTGRIAWEDTFAGRISPLSDGYLLSMSDGTACLASEDGTIGETFFTGTVSTDNAWETDLIAAAVEMDGQIYVLESGFPEAVYRLEDGVAVQVFSFFDSDLFSEEEIIPGILSLKAQGDTLYAMTERGIYQWRDGVLSEVETYYFLDSASFIPLIPYYLNSIFSIAAAIAFLIWLILIRKGLLAKQLLLMIPCITVIMTLLLYAASRCLNQIYCQKQNDEMLAVCELCRARLDGDALQKIRQDSDPSAYREYEALMLEFSGYNRGSWNSGLDFSLCIPADSYNSYIYADSRKTDVPFTELDIDCTLDLQETYQETPGEVLSFTYYREDSMLASLLGNNETSFLGMAPVYASDGTVSAFLKVSTDSYYLQSDKRGYLLQLMGTALPLAALLLIITSVIAVLISHSLRRAADTVNKIAEGDFSVRSNARSQDEIGDICRQVNHMADSLSAMFEEKDANERFYYKFVPEKFRELLGKERFTDLSLGDAQSREFTVLFCDIRSFSLNSEMLTAKENFEFVNIIYGIAGPIIRSHGGFVDKYIGDAVMALFESADAAVQAGIELYRAIVQDPETAKQLHVSEINIGVGIHTGMARIGIVGEAERLSGTVISDTVNLSSRLESLTKTYHTAMLISKETLDKMDHPEAVRTRYLGMVQVAGVKEVRSLYEVLDCLDDAAREIREENAPKLREAIRLFHLGELQRAESELRVLSDTGTKDPVVPLYLDYISGLNGSDTVFRFVRK